MKSGKGEVNQELLCTGTLNLSERTLASPLGNGLIENSNSASPECSVLTFCVKLSKIYPNIGTKLKKWVLQQDPCKLGENKVANKKRDNSPTPKNTTNCGMCLTLSSVVLPFPNANIHLWLRRRRHRISYYSTTVGEGLVTTRGRSLKALHNWPRVWCALFQLLDFGTRLT